ncbi:MAG: TrkA family potassium uptake protein [Acidimicrobiales bacterium]
MHIVVIGCGRVGAGLSIRLVDHGYSVAIVDKSAHAFRRLPDSWPGQRIVGSGFNRDSLDAAGAKGAFGFAAVTSGDNSNILSARIAREYYGIANVVARIYDPRRAELYHRLGIPTVPTVAWTIDRVIQRLAPEFEASEWSDSSGQLVLVDRVLPPSWAGRSLDPINVKGKTRLVSLTRAGTPRLDIKGVVGQEGDIVHVAVMRDALAEFDTLLAGGVGESPVKQAGRA